MVHAEFGSRHRCSLQVAVMTLIVLRNYQHAGRVLACGALLSSMLLAGCASNAPARQTGVPSVVTPPRVERGNPPFYDVLGQRVVMR